MSEQTERRPGEWPVPRLELVDEPKPQHRRATSDAARFEMVLGSIRAHLSEQPSERCVRVAARCWINAITAATDDTVNQLRRTNS